MGIKPTELDSFSALADGDVLHGVDVSDPTQDPAGSSKKMTLSQLGTYVRAALSQAYVIVNQANVASTLGGVIDSSKVYLIDEAIDMTGVSVTVPAGGITIQGHNSNISQLSCADNAYTMFSSDVGGAGSCRFYDCYFSVTGTGSKVFNMTAAAVGTYFIATRFARFNACTSIGYMKDYANVSYLNCTLIGGTPELELDGSIGGVAFAESQAIALAAGFSTCLFKAGATLSMTGRFTSDSRVDLPASACLTDIASADFTTTSSCVWAGMRVSRNGVFDPTDVNLTPNMSHADPQVYWRNNKGLHDTILGGYLEITAETATTIAVASTLYNLNGTYAANDLEHMSSPASGYLQWDGGEEAVGEALLNLDVSGTAGDVVQVDVKCDRFGGGTDTLLSVQREINNFTGSADMAFFNRVFHLTLNDGDQVYIQIANNTAARDLTGKSDSILMLNMDH